MSFNYSFKKEKSAFLKIKEGMVSDLDLFLRGNLSFQKNDSSEIKKSSDRDDFIVKLKNLTFDINITKKSLSYSDFFINSSYANKEFKLKEDLEKILINEDLIAKENEKYVEVDYIEFFTLISYSFLSIKVKEMILENKENFKKIDEGLSKTILSAIEYLDFFPINKYNSNFRLIEYMMFRIESGQESKEKNELYYSIKELEIYKIETENYELMVTDTKKERPRLKGAKEIYAIRLYNTVLFVTEKKFDIIDSTYSKNDVLKGLPIQKINI